MEVTKRFGVIVRDFKIDCHQSLIINVAAEQELATNWIPNLGNPEIGNAVMLALNPNYPGMIQHFGIVIETNKFIHTIEKTGVIVTPLSHLFFKNKIIGFYRPK